MVSEDPSDTLEPEGVPPVAVPVLVIFPAFTLARVVT